MSPHEQHFSKAGRRWAGEEWLFATSRRSKSPCQFSASVRPKSRWDFRQSVQTERIPKKLPRILHGIAFLFLHPVRFGGFHEALFSAFFACRSFAPDDSSLRSKRA